jgi:hypothetical protein
VKIENISGNICEGEILENSYNLKEIKNSIDLLAS